MKFAVAKEHRDFFDKHGWIEFDQFLTKDQIIALNSSIDAALAQRLEIEKEQLRKLNSDQLFKGGRDLWRLSPELLKSISNPPFTQIVYEFIQRKPIRLGYDQLFPAKFSSKNVQTPTQQIYSDFLEQSATLEDISSINEIFCGVMICLTDSIAGIEPEISEIQEVDIFPKQPGNVIFFKPSTIFNLRKLYEHLEQRYYLVVYTQSQSNYFQQLKDPHSHSLKHLGYVLNDKLVDKLNPIVYR